MNRPLVGILAILLLTIGTTLFVWQPVESDAFTSGFLRTGLVLAALWLALPDTQNPVNRWLMVGVILLAVLLALKPKLIPLAVVILIAMAILRPRGARGRTPRAR